MVGAGGLVPGFGTGWRTPCWSRDVVTNRILPRFFFKKAVTKAVTSRDRAVTSQTRTVGWIDGLLAWWIGGDRSGAGMVVGHANSFRLMTLQASLGSRNTKREWIR